MTTQTTAPVSMKPGPFLFLAILALSSLLTACSGGGASSTPPVEPVLAAPTFTPVPGTYLGPQTVSIADGTASASIYYTLDGSTPTTTSPVYKSPIAVAASQTIRALAVASGYSNSSVATAAYTIRTPGPTVSATQSSNDGTQKFATISGVQFYSGTGGTNPVYVDDSITYQPIEGFGAAFTDTAGYNLQEVATTAAHDEAVNNLFTRNGNGIGLSFMRIPMAASDLALSVYSYDDQPAGLSDPTLANFSIAHDQKDIIPLILQAKALNPDLKLMANPWSPPGWMKSNDSMINGGTLLPADYQPFADYFVHFLQAYQAAGIPIDYVSIQNEPTYVEGYPSLDLQAPDATTVVSQYILPTFTANGISTRILLLDNNFYMISYPQTELANPTIAASPLIAGVAWHGYGGQQGEMQLMANQFPNLGQYETEHSGFSGNANQFKTDFEDITAVMRSSGRTFVKWSLAVNENYGPNTNGCNTCTGIVSINSTTGALSYPADYYSLGHFSKFILPGAQRIYSSNAQGILTSAFLNSDGSKALVAFNDTSSPQTFQVNWGTQSFSYTLPGLAAATFTWTGTAGAEVAQLARTQIQASSFTTLNNLMTENSTDSGAGFDLGFASDGSWAAYKNIDFGSGISGVTARVATQNSGASLEFHLDSPTGALLSTVAVPNTGAWQTFSTVTASASGASGVHDLYVVYRNQALNLNWFVFN